MYSDTAYVPFGEPYAQAGTSDLSFTGLNQDTVGSLYDAGAREYSIQGRWPSPDPAGQSSMHLTDPQSLDRYAYVRNNPVGYVDPSGLDWWDWFGGWGGGGGWGGPVWTERPPWAAPPPPPWLAGIGQSISRYFGIPDITSNLPVPGINERWGGNSFKEDRNGNVIGEDNGERLCVQERQDGTCGRYQYWNATTRRWQDDVPLPDLAQALGTAGQLTDKPVEALFWGTLGIPGAVIAGEGLAAGAAGEAVVSGLQSAYGWGLLNVYSLTEFASGFATPHFPTTVAGSVGYLAGHLSSCYDRPGKSCH